MHAMTYMYMYNVYDHFSDKRTNVLAALGVGFVCVVVGLPLWWKTTEVYRVSLPYSHIQTMSKTQVQNC